MQGLFKVTARKERECLRIIAVKLGFENSTRSSDKFLRCGSCSEEKKPATFKQESSRQYQLLSFSSHSSFHVSCDVTLALFTNSGNCSWGAGAFTLSLLATGLKKAPAVQISCDPKCKMLKDV